MSEAVIVALITGGLSVIGTIITVAISHSGTIEKIDANSKVADEKIKGELNVLKADLRTLSNRVEKHNQVIERTYALERRADVVDEKINNLERSEHHED